MMPQAFHHHPNFSNGPPPHAGFPYGQRMPYTAGKSGVVHHGPMDKGSIPEVRFSLFRHCYLLLTVMSFCMFLPMISSPPPPSEHCTPLHITPLTLHSPSLPPSPHCISNPPHNIPNPPPQGYMQQQQHAQYPPNMGEHFYQGQDKMRFSAMHGGANAHNGPGGPRK